MNNALISSKVPIDRLTPMQKPASDSLLAVQTLIESLEWPSGMKAAGIRLTKVWAGRNKRITLEYRVRVEKDGIHTDYPVQGVIADSVPKCRPRNNKLQIECDLPMAVLLVDNESSCWLTSPDCDPELPVSRMFFERQGPQQILELANARGRIPPPMLLTGFENCVIKVISYRAGRRFVVRLRNPSVDSGGVYLKGFRRPPSPQKIRRASELAEVLSNRSADQIRVPMLLTAIPERNPLVFSEIWPVPDQPEYSMVDVSIAARVASFIHALPKGDDRVHSIDDELNTVDRWGHVLHLLRPDLTMQLQEILSILRARQPQLTAESLSVIHRDFYHAQLLRNEEAIWLTDWDTLGQGHAELDVATYVAHAILNDALANSPMHDPTSRIQGFLEEYRASGATVDLDRLGWYLACSLTRMAAMYSARQYPDAAMAPLWQFAREFSECSRCCLDRLDS